MKYIIMPILISTFLYSHGIKSSITTSYESLDFKNSVQKNDGKR